MPISKIQIIRLLRVSIIMLCLFAIADVIWGTAGLITYIAYNLHLPPMGATTSDMIIFYMLLLQAILCLICYVTYIFRQIFPFDRKEVLIEILLGYSLIVSILLTIWSLLEHYSVLSPVLNYIEFFTNSLGFVIFNLALVIISFIAENYQSLLINKSSIVFP